MRRTVRNRSCLLLLLVMLMLQSTDALDSRLLASRLWPIVFLQRRLLALLGVLGNILLVLCRRALLRNIAMRGLQEIACVQTTLGATSCE